MSAMGAEDESATVREEGTCGEEKVVEGKQPIEKSEFTHGPRRRRRYVPSPVDDWTAGGDRITAEGLLLLGCR